MIKWHQTGFLVLLASLCHSTGHALPNTTRDTISRAGYTLYVIDKASGLDTATRRRMIDAFFTVYPKEVQRFNTGALRTVTFIFDPSYNGIAATGGGVSTFNPAWLKRFPEDIDVVTHEVMHIVQNYRSYDPGWLTEGIADYARYVYGVNNKRADWTLPDYRAGQSYTNAYRVTARFLLWAEAENHPGLVVKLDAAMRDGTYEPGLWKKLTDSSLEQLWQAYSMSPAVELTYH